MSRSIVCPVCGPIWTLRMHCASCMQPLGDGAVALPTTTDLHTGHTHRPYCLACAERRAPKLMPRYLQRRLES